MSYTLQVTFKCLCFFAPETRDGTTRMHVLMPDSRAHAHGGHGHDGHHGAAGGNGNGHEVEAHAVRLVYPRAGGRLALAEPGKLRMVEPGGEGISDFEAMEGWRLHLPGDGGANPALPDELVRVGRVRQELLEQMDHPDLASRVLLTAGEAVAESSPGVWNYRGEERPMAQEVVWLIPGLPGDRLQWHLTSLDGTRQKPLPDVEAVDGMVAIAVHHVTATEFPTPSDDRHPDLNAEHFDLLNGLVTPRGQAIPRFIRKREGRTVNCGAGAST